MLPATLMSIVTVFQNTCAEWMFLCKNGRCILDWWKCDKVDDCGDKTDEIGCGYDESSDDEEELVPELPKHSCPPNYFQCYTGLSSQYNDSFFVILL